MLELLALEGAGLILLYDIAKEFTLGVNVNGTILLVYCLCQLVDKVFLYVYVTIIIIIILIIVSSSSSSSLY